MGCISRTYFRGVLVCTSVGVQTRSVPSKLLHFSDICNNQHIFSCGSVKKWRKATGQQNKTPEKSGVLLLSLSTELQRLIEGAIFFVQHAILSIWIAGEVGIFLLYLLARKDRLAHTVICFHVFDVGSF